MRHCLTLDLKDDPVAIESYDRYHADVWPEVLEDLREIGIDDMTIWRRGTRMVMLLEVPDDFDLRKLAGSPDSHPRVKEWGQLMGTFLKPLPDADFVGLWQPMTEVFKMSVQIAGI